MNIRNLYREITIDEIDGEIVQRCNIDHTMKLKNEKIVDKRIKKKGVGDANGDKSK